MYYGKELREKVMEYAKNHTAKETADVFSIAVRTVFRWKRMLRKKGNLDRAPLNRKPRKLDIEKLRKYVEEHPDAYLKELANALEVSVGCIFKALRKLKITLKKRQGPLGEGTRRNVRSIKGQCPPPKKRPKSL